MSFKQIFSDIFIPNKGIWAVDPALKNFSLSNEELKINLRIDFGTPAKYYKYLKDILSTILLSTNSCSVIKVYGERQVINFKF